MIAIIELALTSIALVGLWGILSPALQPYARRWRQRARLLAALGKEKAAGGGFYRHVDRMLYLVQPNYEAGTSAYRFIALTAFVFLVTLFAVYTATAGTALPVTTGNPFLRNAGEAGSVKIGFGFACFAAIVAASVPYLVLRVRYLSKSVQAGYDLLEIVKTLTGVANLAIDTALTKTADSLPERNVLKRPLKLWAFVLTAHTHKGELKRETERFVRSIGTTFAVAFVSEVLYVYRTGGSYYEAMIRLAEAMEAQWIAVRNAQKEVSDAIQMGAWGNLLVTVVICAGTAFVLSWRVYARLQFQTAMGSVFFAVVVIGVLISLVVSLVLSRPRLDYK
ncbi:hypothetical protein [Cohnella thermotolerans]|uniref:hypothetical protein n=1 Tax=Cohnella thermotolerans TaxID=329858 RepID=UPI00041FD925|nr:hypothetical protein [Cohnella thermotolerans]